MRNQYIEYIVLAMAIAVMDILLKWMTWQLEPYKWFLIFYPVIHWYPGQYDSISGMLKILISVLGCFSVIILRPRPRDVFAAIIYIFGSASNNVELMLFNGVADMLTVVIFPVIFNIADVCQLVGLTLLIPNIRLYMKTFLDQIIILEIKDFKDDDDEN